jgi:hypothetical protein
MASSFIEVEFSEPLLKCFKELLYYLVKTHPDDLFDLNIKLTEEEVITVLKPHFKPKIKPQDEQTENQILLQVAKEMLSLIFMFLYAFKLATKLKGTEGNNTEAVQEQQTESKSPENSISKTTPNIVKQITISESIAKGLVTIEYLNQSGNSISMSKLKEKNESLSNFLLNNLEFMGVSLSSIGKKLANEYGKYMSMGKKPNELKIGLYEIKIE